MDSLKAKSLANELNELACKDALKDG